MFKFKFAIGLMASLFILFDFSHCVFAAGNMHIGKMEVHPFAFVEQKYDDNIFLESTQKNADWITTSAAGVKLEWPFVPGREKDFLLKASYDADYIRYWENTKESRLDHNLSAAADMKFANDMTLKINEDFKKTADPPNDEQTALIKRYRNIARIVLGYEREKIGFDLGYQNILDDYIHGNKNLDKDENIISATAYYRISPKTQVLAEYDFGMVDYDIHTTNSDSRYHQARVGIKGQIAPKLTGTVKVGYKYTTYEQSDKADFRGLTAFGSLDYKIKERTLLNVYGARSSEESQYATNSYYELNKIGFSAEHQLVEKIFLLGGAYYQLDKYPDETTENGITAKRRDNIYNAKIGLRYEMRDWLHFQADYEYKERDSKFGNFDYRDNRVMAKVSALF